MVHEVELEIAVEDRARLVHRAARNLGLRPRRATRVRRWIGASVVRMGERIAGEPGRPLRAEVEAA